MENFTPISASLGGILIGISAIWLMASVGRIAGISGILGGIINAPQKDKLWRSDFLETEFPVTGPLLIIGGILVGLGTQIGSGCTSGHGVCGNARLSLRSLIATLTFMITGVATVFILRHMVGG